MICLDLGPTGMLCPVSGLDSNVPSREPLSEHRKRYA